MNKPAIASRETAYTDFDLRFTPNPNTGDVALKKDVAAVKQSVLNILMTNHGEKPFRPHFGGNLRAYLFENFDDVQVAIIRKNIRTTLTNNEPRITVTNVDVEDLSYRNALQITVEFTIKSPTQQQASVSFVVERIR